MEWIKDNSVNIAVLTICVAIDYITALLLAGVFHKSPKTKDGCLDSSVGYKGIVKKGMLYIIVGIAIIVDFLCHTNYIATVVTTAITINELLSIVENLGNMGIPIPKQLREAITKLKEHENNG